MKHSKKKNKQQNNCQASTGPLMTCVHYKRSKQSVNWAATLVGHLLKLTFNNRDSRREGRAPRLLAAPAFLLPLNSVLGSRGASFRVFSQLVYSSLFKHYCTFYLKVHSNQSCLLQTRVCLLRLLLKISSFSQVRLMLTDPDRT